MIIFTKMHGTGNDFIVIDNNEIIKEDKSNLARVLCNRHLGIGADGLLILSSSKNADIFLEIYNSDGSEATMCGNGVRCVAKYLVDILNIQKDVLKIETKSGIKEVTYANNFAFIATVNVGKATFDKHSMALYTDSSVIYNYPLKTNLGIFDITCVYTGNTHTVVFVENLMLYPFEEIALQIQKNELFQNGTNVEFVQVINKKQIEMLVYERGCGETLGCGSGACAAVYTAYSMHKTENNVDVILKGGMLNVNIDKIFDDIFDLAYNGNFDRRKKDLRHFYGIRILPEMFRTIPMERKGAEQIKYYNHLIHQLKKQVKKLEKPNGRINLEQWKF